MVVILVGVFSHFAANRLNTARLLLGSFVPPPARVYSGGLVSELLACEHLLGELGQVQEPGLVRCEWQGRRSGRARDQLPRAVAAGGLCAPGLPASSGPNCYHRRHRALQTMAASQAKGQVCVWLP